MTTIDTVVIGAGHAGLAVSKLLTGRRTRPRRARPRPVGRPLAHRALGLPAPAHPELDDPAPRLELPRARPGRLPQRRRVRRLPRGVRRLVRRARGRRAPPCTRSRRARRPPGTSLPRRHQPRHLARPPRRHRDRAARDAARAGRPGRPRHPGSTWSPRTTTATPAGSAPGGVLVVGASASGHADRRRAQPGRSRGHPRGRPAHPDAPALPRPGHLLVARDHRPPGPDHRRGGRPGGRARGDLAAARGPRRPRAGHRGPRPRRASRSAASASSDGSTRSTAAPLASATTSPPPSAPRTRRLDRLLDSLDHFVERIGLAGQLWDSPRPRPVAIGPRGAGSTCAPRASAPCWWPPATAPTTRGCDCRSPTPTGASASTGA